MNESELPSESEKTPLILPRLVTRHISQENGITHSASKTKYMAPFLIVVALERFTYYSIVVNLFLFFKDNVYDDDNKHGVGRGPTSAIVSVMVLIGLSWLFCVLGGWISDAKLGKLRTIICGFVIYALGTGLLLGTAYCLKDYLDDDQSSYRALAAFVSIIIALIGEGAVKANIAAFGAEQLDQKDQVSTRRYFTLYYFCLNIGALLALSITAYIQQWQGFKIGFWIPLGSITLALLVFVLSRKRYKTLPCQRIVGKVYQIVKEARRNYKRNGRSNSAMAIQQQLSWLDYAKMKYGGSFLDWEVDEVRFLFAVIPVFIVLLPYQIIYNQMGATFLQQGIHMNIHFDHFPHFPAAWLYLFNSVIIVILLPIMDKVVYPWLTKRGYSMASLTRISIGILVACFAVIAAGVVEIYVVRDFKRNETVLNENVNRVNVTAAKLSVFYQLPQYLLIGIGEVFASVGGLEFAYRNAPQSMQGLVMALFFSVISLGSLLGSGLLALSEVCGIITREKKSHDYYNMTYYFFLLGGLMLLSWIVFIVYIENLKRKRSKKPRIRMFNRTRGARSPDITSDISKENYSYP